MRTATTGQALPVPQHSLQFYRLLARLRWPKSYAGRLTLVCLVCANLPLSVVAMVAAWHLATVSGGAAIYLAIVVCAASIGAAITSMVVREVLAPVLIAAEALQGYSHEGKVPSLPTEYGDEAGRLMREVQETVAGFEAAQNELRRHADTDALTGLSNRRSFFARAIEEVARSRRSGDPLALVLFDIDFFKAINDTHGHAAGDSVLRILSGAVTRQLRMYDRFGRIGGEEFAVMLPGARREEALVVAERLREKIASLPLPVLEGACVTASFGVAVLEAPDSTLEEVMERADRALYDAKHGGRNRVTWRSAMDEDDDVPALGAPATMMAATGKRGTIWELD